ncbi:hypothetical protein HCN44_000708 [Aphidius gifuensis]|uniref:CAAX prenyl protease 2 n=1 Tax=Aphidius gifuensis TaxID=684658 RepID=A0A835CR56_APHGI|nr:CAAX prenyl protease 2 [Aphidius gifuensis]XP_044011802.1 CAAX prenyl protease 2 [Aphidius gifuensis]KAF7990903.1 hypothetical protein HCN44_000708 [Aphidius gifuensis]
MEHSQLQCTFAIFSCTILSIIYVASLYIWKSPHSREHPSTIKKRFLSVFIISLISPVPLYIGLNQGLIQQETLWELLGLRWSGLLQAVLIPLFLTIVLFLGPITMLSVNGSWRFYGEPTNWLNSIKSLIWWRNLVVAPLSEEWTFRACMLPLLMQCFNQKIAIFICPLFFGIAHFHHIVDRMKKGMEFKHAFFISSFQFAYTTLFGIYAAFLFAKTGHIIASFTAHSFCNHMGFPDISEVLAYKNPVKRAGLLSLFFIGLIAWCFLLTPLTNPKWFNNNIFWNEQSV